MWVNSKRAAEILGYNTIIHRRLEHVCGAVNKGIKNSINIIHRKLEHDKIVKFRRIDSSINTIHRKLELDFEFFAIVCGARYKH